MTQVSLSQALKELNSGQINKGKATLNILAADQNTAEQALILLFKVAMSEKDIEEASYLATS